MPRAFRLRGIVEGFYGRPWSHEARLSVLSFVAERAMNAYVYAPKDDPLHRGMWREPYDADALARFRELAKHSAGLGVSFGFAISPGLDIEYESEADRAVLLGKLRPLLDAGVPWYLLLLDDIPYAPGLAPRQADLASWLLARLRAEWPDAVLTVCPTEYVGTRPSPYLSDLAAGLPPEVDVMWTGPTVCSPEISADDARSWASALGGRAPLLWDNYPVNDGAMDRSLHLGPYRGREADLADATAGVLCNPMSQAYASQVALATAADFLAAPDDYDAGASWARAVADVGGARCESFAVLARACRDSALCAPDELDLARGVERLADALDGGDWESVARELVDELRAARELPGVFGADASEGDDIDALSAEVAPWADAARAEADAGLAALKLINLVRGAEVDPERAMHLAFLMIYTWSAARANTKVAYGPRFAIYPAVVQLGSGAPGLDVSLAVREDANAIDALCRLALATYDTHVFEANPAGFDRGSFKQGLA